MKSIREILASPLAISVMEIFKSPSKKKIEALGSAEKERENTYVTIRTPKKSPSLEGAELGEAIAEGFDEAKALRFVKIDGIGINGPDSESFRFPEYQREPIVPIGEIAALAAEFREKIKQQRRAFYDRKKSQAKNWRKWRR